ncbi:hypothetical protein [Rhizorhabdus argentea]|uniref:hypothetical protein n=1 Tax=Rhizorhabdus argentea TaxID=1387174 RepID=UPI0030ED2E87
MNVVSGSMTPDGGAQAVMPAERQDRRVRIAIIAAGALLLVALFSRVMGEELRHDEQIYFPIGMLFGQHALYQEMSYAHLPNLPILLHWFLLVTATDHYFLAARLLVFLCWVGLLYAFAATAWRLSASKMVTIVSVVLLVTNALFVDYQGMIIATHLFPIAFATLALLFFLDGMAQERVSSIRMLLCGVCLSVAVGFKANYVVMIPPFAIASLLLPVALPLSRRLLSLSLPMMIGGIIGGLPTFYYLATHSDAFLFDVFEYFIGPHTVYWSRPEHAGEVIGLSLSGRLVYGYRLWSGGSTLLVIAGIIGCVVIAAARQKSEGSMTARFGRWPVLLCLALTLCGLLVSFVPKPSFSQYFMPPVPFAILLLAALAGSLTRGERAQARPLLIALGIAALIAGLPMLLADIPKLLHPAKWEGNRIHAFGERIRAELAFVHGTPRIATLAPVYAIEAGLKVYPELASGPFYYRVGDYLTAEQRRAYHITSPTTIGELLGRDPPDAILIGQEGAMEIPLQRFALQNGYRLVPHRIGADRYGEAILYIRSQR